MDTCGAWTGERFPQRPEVVDQGSTDVAATSQPPPRQQGQAGSAQNANALRIVAGKNTALRLPPVVGLAANADQLAGIDRAPPCRGPPPILVPLPTPFPPLSPSL